MKIKNALRLGSVVCCMFFASLVFAETSGHGSASTHGSSTPHGGNAVETGHGEAASHGVAAPKHSGGREPHAADAGNVSHGTVAEGEHGVASAADHSSVNSDGHGASAGDHGGGHHGPGYSDMAGNLALIFISVVLIAVTIGIRAESKKNPHGGHH